MADSITPQNNIRGNNNNTSSNGVNEASPSRLLLNTNSLRNDLQSRNLYTPNRIYPITEKTQVQNVINAVGSIASIVLPFKSFNLKNTVFARLVASSTPLTEIGLIMLGKLFALNAGSHIAQQTFPTIKPSNLFDGSKETKLFTKNINYNITKKQKVTNFQDFLDSMIFYYPGRDYPFKPTSTNANFVENTGTGQLTFLFQAMNKNIYKEGFTTTLNDTTLTQLSEVAKPVLTTRSTIVDSDLSKYRNYFNYFNNNPYTNISPNPDSVTNANNAARIAINYSPKTQEYAPSADFVRDNFGQTNNNNKEIKLSEVENSWINAADEFGDESYNKIVWGRDGISPNANDNINKLRGTSNNADEQVDPFDNFNSRFNAKSGLLEYTRNLLNASEGAIVDITRKAFLRGQNVAGFNGSGLWVANDSTYAGRSETAGKTGVRQHSTLDQYDRFAKAIRFNGNSVYNGNENSVIYNSVLPRIHPTLNTDKTINNKNLMFSIENLAVRVISKDGIGIIDDEYGSSIPVCEVGPFNGRQMWFPPYNMEINETSTAKFESTVMVGRNEPMYNYMFTERGATLSFVLLVDYPPNLKNAKYHGANRHKEIAEFFAFGGDAYNPNPIVNNPSQKVVTNNDNIEQITGPTDTAEPENVSPVEIGMSFPNDFPNESEVNTAIDTMYKDYQYEIESGCMEANKTISSLGLNSDIYVVMNLIGNTINQTRRLDKSAYGNTSQYSLTSDKSILNSELKRVFENEKNRDYFHIIIVGGASKLYTEQNKNDVQQEKDYNKALGLRRANAVKKLVEERIKALFGQYPDKIGINIMVKTTGSDAASQDNATAAAINLNATKEERYVKITIERNNIVPTKKIQLMSLTSTQNIEQITKDNMALDKVEKQSSNNASQCVFAERNKDSAAILKGFQGVEGNYYQPVFHSQTPEDFHRRLTFLHQCTRQGAAKRYDVVDDNGIPRAKNSVFGRQPICILRVGDFFYTKVIIESLNIDYTETTWDMNPEGWGMQPMLAKVTLQMKVIGGQSLKGPIDALQNAVTFNYYANSTFTKDGMYERPWKEAEKQEGYINGILTTEKTTLENAYNNKVYSNSLQSQYNYLASQSS